VSTPRLNLTHVASFLALVDTGGFSAAARSLGLSQAAVSQHLKRLEDSLAVPLINRARTGCTPTAAAARFLPVARSLLAVEARAIEVLDGTVLRLGACSNLGVYVLPGLMRGFVASGGAVPKLSIAANPAVADRLQRAEIDVALMEWWDGRPGFRAERWREEPIVAIAAPGHPWAVKSAISIADLAVAPMIGGEPGTGTGRLLRGHLNGADLPRPVLELGSTEAVKRAVMGGLGTSVVLAIAVADEARDGRLVARPLRPEIRKPLYLVWRDELPTSHSLIDFLRGTATLQ
jgi:DNA-binding transcriptional LysR family regulator